LDGQLLEPSALIGARTADLYEKPVVTTDVVVDVCVGLEYQVPTVGDDVAEAGERSRTVANKAAEAAIAPKRFAIFIWFACFIFSPFRGRVTTGHRIERRILALS
jgi:hypothetical protein